MEGDKPFKCLKCLQAFANSDHLAVHQLMHIEQHRSLQVKIPGVSGDNLADQTPTPTRFLKTAEVDGSQLFEDINPFDQDFKLASKRQHSTCAEQNPSIGSTTDANSAGHLKLTIKKNKTALSKDSSEDEQSPSIGSTTGEMASISEDLSNAEQNSPDILSQTVPVIASVPTCSSQTSSVPATPSDIVLKESLEDSSTSSRSTSNALIQSVLQQIRTQSSNPNENSISVSSADSLPKAESSASQQKPNISQEVLREQLKALIKSGQIKIQFTSPDPASPKVQATIVGSVPTKTSNTHAQTVLHQQAQQQLQQINVPKSVTPQAKQTVITPMSVLSVPTATIVPTNHATNPGTNLALAKQKLKQVIQQQQNANTIHFMSNRVTMATSASSQGKYKDIILEDEMGLGNDENDEIGMKRKGRHGEEATPEDKRKRFLERNRAAASRCRQKRKIWVNQLERKSDDLLQTNNQLVNEISVLRSEVAQLKALLLAHKDCPVTVQQKALLMGQITTAGTYIAVSDGGQIIGIHQLPHGVQPSSAEEVASSALTDMASRATIELGNRVTSGTVTVQANDGSVTTISSNLLPQ